MESSESAREPSASHGLGPAVAWAVVFAAVLTHLSAVGFDFAQDDFDALARAAGLQDVSGWPLRPFSTWIVWVAQWPLFGTSPTGYHGTALVAFGALALAVARVARRWSGSDVAAALAGFAVALGPTTWLPIAWVSASAEIWAVLFAVVALDLWTDPRGGARPLWGALFALLSLTAKESGLGLVVILALASTWWSAPRSAQERRGRHFLLGLLALASALTAIQVARAFDTGPESAYALGGVGAVVQNLLLLLADAAWPWTVAVRGTTGLVLGGAVLLGWIALAGAGARRGDRVILMALLWSLSSLAPVLLLRDHLYSYYALGAQVGAAWAVGHVLAPRVKAWLGDGEAGRRRAGAALAAGLVVVSVLGGYGVQGVTHARDADGRLIDPILHRTSITQEVRQQLAALQNAASPPEVVVLQAARVTLPENFDVPEGGEVLLRSPVFASLRGNKGLRLLLGPDVSARWVTHLDEVDLDGSVLLDVGDDRLRVLGPLENARLYSGLIAVAAGQFSRARHDFWHAIRLQGAQVRFAFDPDALPILPEELDAEAPRFARYLMDRDEVSADRILRLFEQMYEEIRGKELIRGLEVERPPRLGG